MSKAYYNGATNKLIAYKGDRLPVKLYAQGQEIKSLSAIKGTAFANGSLMSYESEYNNNLLLVQIYGNSVQEATPSPTAPQPIKSAENAVLILRSSNIFDYDNVTFNGMVDELPTDRKSYSMKFDNSFFFHSNVQFDNGSYDRPYFYFASSLLNLKPNTTYTSRATVTLKNLSTDMNWAGSMSLSWFLQDNNSFSYNASKFRLINGYIPYTGSGQTEGTYTLITQFTTPNQEVLDSLIYVVTRLSGPSEVTYKDVQIVPGSYTKDTFPEYEAYKYKSVNIPAEALLSDGTTTLSLLLEGVGGVGDVLATGRDAGQTSSNYVKRTNYYTFTGEEVIRQYSGTDSYYIVLPDDAQASSGTQEAYCTHFKWISSTELPPTSSEPVFNISTGTCEFFNTGKSTLGELKQFLAESSVSVLYALGSPRIYENIKDEQFLLQMSELMESSFFGTNFIECTSDNVQVYRLDSNYWKWGGKI